MNNKILFSYIAVVALLLSACKKEGDTINNYYSPDEGKFPDRMMLKGYGVVDSSSTIRFNYQNNQIGKLKEFITYDGSGIATSKMIILYNGSNQPVGYQSYTLPVNTLNAQGTYKLNSSGQVTTVIQRKVNGDTTGICYFQYGTVDYQPTSFTYYDKTADRNTTYEYFTYDKSGNLVKSVQYSDNGTDPLYKVQDAEAGGYGKGINGLNQLYYYLIAQIGSYGYSSSGALYFSSYMPTSVRSQSYKPNGDNSSAGVSNLDLTLDDHNNVILLNGLGASAPIYLKY